MFQTLAGTTNSPRVYGGRVRAGGPPGAAAGVLPAEPAAQARTRQENRQKYFCRSARAPAANQLSAGPGVRGMRLAIGLAPGRGCVPDAARPLLDAADRPGGYKGSEACRRAGFALNLGVRAGLRRRSARW